MDGLPCQDAGDSGNPPEHGYRAEMTRIKLHLLLAVAPLGLMLGGPALSADLSVAPTYKAPAFVTAPYSWTGFYVGANLGYGVGQSEGTYTFGPGLGTEIFNSVPGGVFGGGQIGYNYQIGSIVIGAETDIQGSGISDTRTCLLNCFAAGTAAQLSQKLDWFGTTRARVGLATGPVLTYITGGLAYGETETGITTTLPAGGSAVTTTSNRSGWVWGTGVEAALGGNWTAKAEYLYVDLGSVAVAGTVPAAGFTGTFSTKYQEQLFRGGVNYKFGPEQTVASYGPAYNWNGLFIGGVFSYGLGRDPSTLTVAGATNETFDLSPRGFLGGGIAGYNWQFGRWVTGIETDVEGNFGDGYLTCAFGCTAATATVINQKTPWIGTTRGRLGYAVGPALFYGTAGVAYGESKESITATAVGTGSAFSFDHTNVGWTAGGGIENKLDILGLLGPNWTTRTEYLYVDLGNVSDTFTNAAGAQTLSSNVHEHLWRTVVTYKFGDTGFGR
jgi:outer membrane immunogenic protein